MEQPHSETASPLIRIGLGDGMARTTSASIAIPPRELLLCATLGLHGRPLPTETLLEEIWPESEPVRARSCLKVHVHRIRARFRSRDALIWSAERWSLGPHVSLDVWEWERVARSAAPAPAIESARLALAQAFEGLLTGPAPSLARSHLAPRLDALFGELLGHIGGRLIDDALMRLDLVRATSLARSAIAIDPYGQRWYEALIRAHILSGDVAGARSWLRTYRTTLEVDLGEPVPKAVADLVT